MAAVGAGKGALLSGGATSSHANAETGSSPATGERAAGAATRLGEIITIRLKKGDSSPGKASPMAETADGAGFVSAATGASGAAAQGDADGDAPADGRGSSQSRKKGGTRRSSARTAALRAARGAPSSATPVSTASSSSVLDLGATFFPVSDPAHAQRVDEYRRSYREYRAGYASGAKGETQDVAPRTSTSSRPPPFLLKLAAMLDDPHNKEYITWTEDGSGIFIKQLDAFSSMVLPRYFKHSNFNSFLRQLNMYNFYTKDQKRGEWRIFHNPNFHRGVKDAHLTIQRNAKPADKDGGAGDGASGGAGGASGSGSSRRKARKRERSPVPATTAAASGKPAAAGRVLEGVGPSGFVLPVSAPMVAPRSKSKASKGDGGSRSGGSGSRRRGGQSSARSANSDGGSQSSVSKRSRGSNGDTTPKAGSTSSGPSTGGPITVKKLKLEVDALRARVDRAEKANATLVDTNRELWTLLEGVRQDQAHATATMQRMSARLHDLGAMNAHEAAEVQRSLIQRRSRAASAAVLWELDGDAGADRPGRAPVARPDSPADSDFNVEIEGLTSASEAGFGRDANGGDEQRGGAGTSSHQSSDRHETSEPSTPDRGSQKLVWTPAQVPGWAVSSDVHSEALTPRSAGAASSTFTAQLDATIRQEREGGVQWWWPTGAGGVPVQLETPNLDHIAAVNSSK